MRRIIAALCMVMMLVSAASAEDFLLGVEPEKTEITPAYRSEHRPEHKNCYWCTPMDLTDEEAVWKMLTAPITVVDLDMMKQTVCYSEPDENSEQIGMITGSSQSQVRLRNAPFAAQIITPRTKDRAANAPRSIHIPPQIQNIEAIITPSVPLYKY